MTRTWAMAATAALAVLACARSSGDSRSEGVGAPSALPVGRGAELPVGSFDRGRGVRIVCVGGAVCETVFALGAGDQVVAVDTSTGYWAGAAGLPRVGYQRALSAEPILALGPDLVIAAAEAGPAVALEQLRAAGVRVAVMPEARSPESAAERIRQVAAALGKDAEGRALAGGVVETSRAAAARRAGRRVRVAFVYARGSGTVMVAGRDTPAGAMLALAGADNAVDGYQGYKPLSAEALVAAAPDAILVPARGLASLGGAAGLLAQPGVADTPAGRTGRIVAMDDLLLLGFGPRLGEAIDELAGRLAEARDARADAP